MASTFFNWLRSPASREYFFSTHFWGPAANWGLPLAALTDLRKDEEVISGPMTSALVVYSMAFMRFAWRVQPRNYLLLACHVTNATAQIIQDARYINYWYYGGKEKKLSAMEHANESADAVQGEVTKAIVEAREEAKKVAQK